jgi:hypothetical protein
MTVRTKYYYCTSLFFIFSLFSDAVNGSDSTALDVRLLTKDELVRI